MPDLRSIVFDLCRRAGLDPASEVDAEDLSGRVDGMAAAQRATVRSCLEALASAYALDAVESGGKVRFIRRGGTVCAAIVEDDLVPFPHEDGGQTVLAVNRRQDAELPRQIDLGYLAKATDWQPSVQSARRLAVGSENVVSLPLPLALSDDEARRIAEELLAEAWRTREEFVFRTASDFAWLDPGDVVTLTVRGVTRRLRLVRTQTTATMVDVHAVADGAAMSIPAIGSEPFAWRGALTGIAQTVAFLLDLPLLRDEDEGVGFYAAASFHAGVGGTWRGAVLHRSRDGGGSYEAIADLDGPATWGVCATALGAGTTVAWDEANTVTVTLRQGQLESRPAAAVLNGANAALVGNEIVQFRGATLVGPDSYALSGLLRGRRGTEHEVGGHGAGETFLLLSAADLRRLSLPQELIGASRPYKAVSLGGFLDDQPALSFAGGAAGLRPYGVAHVRGVRNQASGDWTITWVRRARRHGGWIDGADVPLGEDMEAYDVDILNEEGAVVRGVEGLTSPALLYGAAEQAADFGGPRTTLRIRVCQVSATIGRGVAREVWL